MTEIFGKIPTVILIKILHDLDILFHCIIQRHLQTQQELFLSSQNHQLYEELW